MKKEYVIPQMLKYVSLQDITLAITPQACTNQGSGCSGSCMGVSHGLDENYKGYKWICQ